MNIPGIFDDETTARIERINRFYDIYEGRQEWEVNTGDYKPTVKITNWVKKLVDKKARFLFGNELYFNFDNEEQEQFFQDILRKNRFHEKLLKALKDLLIGGNMALRIFADRDTGVRLLFSPAQEFIVTYGIEDIDRIERAIFFYWMKDSQDKREQRIKRQVWELQDGECVLDERTFNGYGEVISVEYDNFHNGLDFIPVIVFQNGGLTGETEGSSDVERLWSNQNAYNHLTSDDIDALKSQMFGQDVFTDASEDTLESIRIAPGAVIDLKTDTEAQSNGKQANVERLEGGFSYSERYDSALDEIKDSLFSLMDIPNTSLAELKGMMASGKSMKAVYWDLISVSDELFSMWESGLYKMVDMVFKMIYLYGCYGGIKFPPDYDLVIEKYYPIPEDNLLERKTDLEEVINGVRSKRSYLKKWSSSEDIEEELKEIAKDMGEGFGLNDE